MLNKLYRCHPSDTFWSYNLLILWKYKKVINAMVGENIVNELKKKIYLFMDVIIIFVEI